MRRHRFAFAFIALVALAIFLAPLLRQEVFTLRDHLDYFQPLRWFTAQELRAGHLPLWNPYNASGEAWLANPQTNVFYPPAWLFLVLPFETAYMLFLLLHLVLLGWGAYLFFARGLSPGAAMAGAVALMLSGPVLSLLDINNNLASFAWIPLALWCAAEHAPIRGGFALALAFLAGEPFLAAVAAVMYVLVSRKARDVAIAALVAFGVSAIQLLPFLELIAGSDRAAGMAGELIFRDSMPLRDWLRLVVPPSLDASGFDARLGQHFIPIVYVGIVVALLAFLGLRRRTLGWLALLAAVIVIAAGPSLLAPLPLTLFRYPARVVPLAALAIAALAAAGWDRIRPNRRWVDLVLILVVVADLLPRARPLLQTAPFRRDAVPYPRAIGAESKFLRVGDADPARRMAWISGYLNLYDRRFDAYTAAPIANERYLRFHRQVLAHPTAATLNALPAGWILTSLALQPPFEFVTRAENVSVYRNPHARSMAVLMTREGVVPARATIGTSHARVIVDAAADGVLVLAQQDAPSWRVRVDGKNAVKRRVFGLFLGVAVPKGHHEVIWSYRSYALFAGGAMTLVTLFSIQLFLFV
jgi:hypothetical protein